MNPEIIIIGAGPAGMAAALQLKRYGLSPRLIEKEEIGGLLRNSRRIENYPGFYPGISGKRLCAILKKHLRSFDIPVEYEEIIELDYDEKSLCFYLKTAGASGYPARVVVVASGTRPKKMPLLDALNPELKKKVFFEIVSLLKLKNKKIVIVGAGDAAFDYALNLAGFNDIVVLNRGHDIRALNRLKDELMKNKKILYLDNAAVRSILPGKELSLAVRIDHDGASKALEADFLVAAIGRVPGKEFYSSQLQRLEKKLISRKELFTVGDVKNGKFRQVAIAVGDGIRAAMDIHRRWGKQA